MTMPDKPSLEGVYLAHFGVKGMRWGHRKASSSVETAKRSHAGKPEDHPNFRREVNMAKKGGGVAGGHSKVKGFELNKAGQHTGRLLGEFRDSKGHKVSVDFANAVMKKAVSEQRKRHRLKIGAMFAAALVTKVALDATRPRPSMAPPMNLTWVKNYPAPDMRGRVL